MNEFMKSLERSTIAAIRASRPGQLASIQKVTVIVELEGIEPYKLEVSRPLEENTRWREGKMTIKNRGFRPVTENEQ